MSLKASASFWQGKRVFVTYPTSFLGAWTALSLYHLGAQVFGFAPSSRSVLNFFDLSNLAQNISMTYGDLRDEEVFRQTLQFAQADVVIHLGEFGLLKDAESKPLEIFSNAVMGTAILMELLRETASVRSVVVLSSDKVYARSSDNNELIEQTCVAAKDILPTAKLCSEFIALSYRQTFFNPEKYNKHKIALATARIGNSIGGGDFTEGSLIPDFVRSFFNKTSFEIRNPNSVRPWIHVLDQVNGILMLAEALYEKGPKLSPSYNLGATEYESIAKVITDFSQIWNISKFTMNPSTNTEKSALSFHGRLNSNLAKENFGWAPQWDLTETLSQTAKWYLDYYSGNSSPEQVSKDIETFFQKKEKGA
ncbi:MAG: CDP-glucose 4,6-dehydratase [Pseudobdellovibrionaceae bacterium]